MPFCNGVVSCRWTEQQPAIRREFFFAFVLGRGDRHGGSIAKETGGREV